jgi:NAD(P) transhydrogenase
VSDYDLAIIGCGPAGEKAAAQAAYFGKRVIIFECADEPGGAAVQTGTLPSKTLREAAMYLSGYRNRELYGVAVELNQDATVRTLLDRTRVIRQGEASRMRQNLARHRVTYRHDFAEIMGPHVVRGRNSGEEITASWILIATGSVPYRPVQIDFASDRIHDTDEILSIEEIPKSLTIIGAGVIGCEYACMFSALGTAVTVVDRNPAILTFLDRELVLHLQRSMERSGVRFLLSCNWGAVHATAAGVDVEITGPDGTEPLSTSDLLFATGRSGRLAGLGLERVGIEPNARGQLQVDEHFATSVPSILAAGDVIGFPALAATSMEQGRVAVCHAFNFDYKTAVSAILPYGIYTIPEVSAVGETEQSAHAKGIDYVCGRTPYGENARGLITGDTEGMTKLLIERSSHRVIGVHVIGERATELVHIGQMAVATGARVEVFIELVFNYPTLSESYKYAAYNALQNLGRGQ